MRAVLFRRRHLEIAVATATLALTISSTVPVQAQATAPEPHPNTNNSIMCLYHANSLCAAANINPVVQVLGDETQQIGIGVAVGVIIYFILKKLGGGGKPPEYAMEVNGYYPRNHGYPTNECLGAWGYNAHPHLGSCKSAHGIYWDMYCLNKSCAEFRLYNTYSRGYLVTDPPGSLTRCGFMRSRRAPITLGGDTTRPALSRARGPGQ